ncbi:MAG TPA: helix-turn-helix transcriptional regulator [Thermoanaerobaculia bacterium]|nr:helix-turn-helix transcriptional regulator [Thermoanaerobaculia bacterium]
MDRRRRDAASYLPLRPVELYVLLSLAAGERHGYAILQESEALGGPAVPDVGTLYRALRRMREQELIAECPPPDGEELTDERRNYYRLTPLGREVGEAEARRLDRLTVAARSRGFLAEVA